MDVYFATLKKLLLSRLCIQPPESVAFLFSPSKERGGGHVLFFWKSKEGVRWETVLCQAAWCKGRDPRRLKRIVMYQRGRRIGFWPRRKTVHELVWEVT